MLPKALKFAYDDIKQINTGVKLVVLVIFLRTFGWGFVDPFFSIFIDTFSKNYTAVGLMISLMGLISFLAVIPLLRLADRVKDTRIMEDGEIFYLFAIIFYIAAGFMKSLPLLMIALTLNGIGLPLVVVGAEAFIRKHNGKSGSASAFGFYTALNYFGWILGMVIAAFLVPYYNFNTMFLFILPSVIISFFILPRIHERGFRSFLMGLRRYFHRTQDFKDIVQDIKNLDRRMFFFLVLAFLDGLITIFSYVFIPLFALTLDLSLQKVALLMAVMYFPFIFSFFFSEMADRMKKMNVIAFGLFVGAISFILLTFIVHQMWIVILATMASLSLAIIRPAYNGMITQMTPVRMLGEISGLNNMFFRIGQIVGPVFSGLIADAYGIKFAFLLIAILALALGIITLLLRGYEYLAGDVKIELV